MKYKCLVFDHDDTVVNSTAGIHYPCFVDFLALHRPKQTITLEDYFIKNFDPGFIAMCREDYGMSDAEIAAEGEFWHEYVRRHVPKAYPGIREIMLRQKAEGGYIVVISHSLSENIYRDYVENNLPRPDASFGWEYPPEKRKPYTWPLEETMRMFSLAPSDVLVIDDLKPGFDMASAAGVEFAASGWANDIACIEEFMRKNAVNYFKKVSELAAFLG